MPTYEYSCGSCGHRFERFMKITENVDVECPICGQKSSRMISAGIGLIFKGTGFYITDYRKSNHKEKIGERG